VKEQTANSDQSQTETVTDLELSSEQAEQVEGGAISPFGGFRGGVSVASGDVN
jgi:hypothetical protein